MVRTIFRASSDVRARAGDALEGQIMWADWAGVTRLSR